MDVRAEGVAAMPRPPWKAAPRSAKPRALAKVPRLMVRKWVVGYTAPTMAPAPSSDDTGSSMPENWIAGSSVPMEVPTIAATWLSVPVDISSPSPVVAMT